MEEGRGVYRVLVGRPNPFVGICEHDNEASDSIKGGEFFLQAERMLVSQQGLCVTELKLRS
jgi:hypothetical protein